MNLKKDRAKEMIFLILIFMLAVSFLATLVIHQRYTKKEQELNTAVDWSKQIYQKSSSSYFAQFQKVELDEQVPSELQDELAAAGFQSAGINPEAYGITFLPGSLSLLGEEANTRLYEICATYFLADYQGKQLSPLIPMAIANCETGSRKDLNITYSSLFPSGIIPINHSDEISEMNCLRVLESPEIFNTLAGDHWTRDRGALQLNPDYGVAFEAFNSLMGESEKEILRTVNPGDYPGYIAFEGRSSTGITVNSWLGWVSEQRGDRFNVRDSVLRLASAVQGAISQIQERYEVSTDTQLLVMIGQFHGAASVFTESAKNSKVGNWKSGRLAHEYSVDVGSEEMYQLIYERALSDLQKARAHGRDLPMVLTDVQVRDEIWPQAQALGIVKEYTHYIHQGNYYWVTYCYPIRLVYAHAMLSLVYSGY